MINKYNAVLYLTILKAMLALDNKSLATLLGYSEVHIQRIMSQSKLPTQRLVNATESTITALLGPVAIYNMSNLIAGAFADEYK